MTYLIVLGLYVGILFVVGFLSRRSMGLPTLALAAGALLADLWTDSLTPLVVQAGLVVIQPPLKSIVAVALTLVPALIVMVKTPKMRAHHHGIFGSIVFAVLGTMLTYAAFSNAVILDSQSRQYVLEMVKYQNVIVTVCVVLAIADVIFYRKPVPLTDKKRKSH